MTTDTGNTADMLDENFIKAVGPAPEASNNPFVVLKDLVTALVVDATTIGKNAVIHAFVTGADVVSRPELTAASYPYVAPTPSDTVHIPFPAPPVPADLQPMLAQAVTAILAEGAAGDQAALGDAAAAALETGTALGGPDPTALLDKFRAVIASEVQPVWENALSVVTSLPQPTIGETVTNISHLSTLLDGADLSRRVTADPEATPPTEGPQPSGHDAAASLTRRVSAAPPALAATPPPLSAAPNGPKPSHPALSAAIGKLKATVAAARADRANKRSDRG